MSTWTNDQFMKWLTEARVSSLSQEHLKIEAEKFSGKFEDLDKKTIAKVVENFEKDHKKVHADVSHSIFEELGGLEGKMRGRKDMPPKDYFPQDQTQLKMIKCENSQTKCEICDVFMSSMVEVTSHIQMKHTDSLKRAFSKEVMAKVSNHTKYLDWLKRNHIVNQITSKHFDKEQKQKQVIVNHDENCFKMIKSGASGEEIIETQRTIISQQNGIEKKIVKNYQFANITTRTKETENKSGKRKHSEGERKQAKKITNILDHMSGNDEDREARILSNVIHQKSQKFAGTLASYSKELQDKQKFSPEETASLISGAKLSDNALKKLRTAENKVFGHNRFASHKKVVAAREKILPINRF